MRNRGERASATGPLGRADRSLTGASGPLLPPRLPASATNRGTVLGRGRPLTLIGQVRLHRLVQDRLVDDAVEEGLGQCPLVPLLAVGLVVGCLEHCHHFWIRT